MIRWRRDQAILLPTAEWQLQRRLTATAADTKRLSELDPDLAGLDADRVGLQCLLATYDVEQLNARREIGPVDDLARADIEARPMQGTLDFAAVDDFAAPERRERVGAACLRGKEPVLEVIKQNLLALDLEHLHLANVKLVFPTYFVKSH